MTPSTLQDFVLIDIDKAIHLMGDKEFIKEIFQLFTDNLTAYLAILKQHYQARNWSAIQAIAYKWRVEASYCGANRLGKVCQQLETLLQRRLFEEAEMYYQSLLEAAVATKEAAKNAITALIN
ncbi:sensory box histidine kinase/response regulator [Candidatus Rickettsiella viridis]|uniref:Sensory box histidine kinase/response regulator n=1 Tax=Candidatus Rickettsiella viridis TaxID=676208 RepID=A0A2Z5UTN8_9COXI|nr:Hpt domain-containing protein [Candidatus Rickettsiella viridis]BBB14976.1 sensory box histidine kinase/response regulator [Candidatus Rickettsiella viridis]